MVTKNNTDLLKSTKLERYFVPDEHECFSQVKTNPIEHSDLIRENGYTGVVKGYLRYETILRHKVALNV